MEDKVLLDQLLILMGTYFNAKIISELVSSEKDIAADKVQALLNKN